MTHTKGPWKANAHPTRVEWEVKTQCYSEYDICECYDSAGDATAEANAHLIAAAPDMLEALKDAERKLASYVGVCDGDKELVEATLPGAHAAIAKAEGKS